jgi:hypothetical protein
MDKALLMDRFKLMEVFIIGPTVSQAIEVIQEYKIGRISY